MNEIAAIPTRYCGSLFRSRLEARWAAMFDLLGWQWEYEPIDLDGYIPDFIINDGMRLVEVKPAFRLIEYEPAQKKIETSGWKGFASCVGAIIGSVYDDSVCLGTEAPEGPTGEWWWAPWILHDRSLASVLYTWREAGNRVQWRGSEAMETP